MRFEAFNQYIKSRFAYAPIDLCSGADVVLMFTSSWEEEGPDVDGTDTIAFHHLWRVVDDEYVLVDMRTCGARSTVIAARLLLSGKIRADDDGVVIKRPQDDTTLVELQDIRPIVREVRQRVHH